MTTADAGGVESIDEEDFTLDAAPARRSETPKKRMRRSLRRKASRVKIEGFKGEESKYRLTFPKLIFYGSHSSDQGDGGEVVPQIFVFEELFVLEFKYRVNTLQHCLKEITFLIDKHGIIDIVFVEIRDKEGLDQTKFVRYIAHLNINLNGEMRLDCTQQPYFWLIFNLKRV